MACWNTDPLWLCNPRRTCDACHNHRRARRKCETCRGVGYARADLAGIWCGRPAFLVCGGPSLARMDIAALGGRGICSLGINNAAAVAPVRAMVFGDPQWKFSHSVFFDPAIIKFSPFGKLRRRVRARMADGTFRMTTTTVAECPNVYGVARTGRYDASAFLTTEYAQWGRGGRDNDQPFRRLCTMLLGLRLLAYLGAPTIYCLGVDFGATGNAYSWGDKTSCGNKSWHKIDAMLREVVETMDRAGVAVRNCSPLTSCMSIPPEDFRYAIGHARGPVEIEPNVSGYYSRRALEANLAQYPDPVDFAGLPPGS